MDVGLWIFPFLEISISTYLYIQTERRERERPERVGRSRGLGSWRSHSTLDWWFRVSVSRPQSRRGSHAPFLFSPVTFGHGTSSGASFELKEKRCVLYVVCCRERSFGLRLGAMIYPSNVCCPLVATFYLQVASIFVMKKSGARCGKLRQRRRFIRAASVVCKKSSRPACCVMVIGLTFEGSIVSVLWTWGTI